MNLVILTLPIKTVSESNCSEHWAIKRKRHKQQQFFVRMLLNSSKPEITLPCKITLTRISSRLLDDDNLVSSLKYIRDEIAAYIHPEKIIKCKKNKLIYENKGHADNDKNITWSYSQEKGLMSVRIEIESSVSPVNQ